MGFCFLSYFVKNFFSFQVNNFWCFYTFLGISMAITLVMMYCSEAASSMSQGFKYVLLLIFTLCYSYMISFCTSLYAQEYGAPLVLEAMVLTSGMCGALTLYAFIVKTDIRNLVAILIVAVFCFIVFGISFAFTLSGTLHTLYATFGVIIGGIILIIDTNWIADGDRGCSLDDPVLGALIIYIDIIRIFLYILRMMGKRGNWTNIDHNLNILFFIFQTKTLKKMLTCVFEPLSQALMLIHWCYCLHPPKIGQNPQFSPFSFQ